MCAEVVMSQDNEQATKTVMTDGLIYYIVPCNKTVLKSNYIYCGYLILDNEQKETIVDIKKRLTKLYAIKDSLPLYIIKTPETKKIYDMLVDKFTPEIHHDNIFMTNQTELKEKITDIGYELNYVLKVVNYEKENSVVIGSKPDKKKKDTNDKEIKVPNRTKKSIEEPKETKQETPKQETPKQETPKQETSKQEQPTRKESSDDESEQVKVVRAKSRVQRKTRKLISEPNESDNSDDFDKPAESAPQ